MIRVVRWTAWAWTLLIVVLLWMPPPPTPVIERWWWDKAIHFGLFAGFAVQWTWVGWTGARVVTVGIAIGVVTELGQPWLPWSRHGSAADVVFDGLGVVFGGMAALGVRRSLGAHHGLRQ